MSHQRSECTNCVDQHQRAWAYSADDGVSQLALIPMPCFPRIKLIYTQTERLQGSHCGKIQGIGGFPDGLFS